MKKIVFIVTLTCVTLTSYGQSIADGLRLGTTDITGTARFRALGGAFGALGGDLSAIGVNPASSAIFTRGTTSFTLAVDNYESDINYFGNFNTTSDSDVSFNQAGGVFLIEANPSSKWNKIALAFNYDRTLNFDDDFFASGTGNISIANYFSEFAQGVPLDLLQLQSGESISSLYQFLGEQEGFEAQQAFLGFQSFIIDPVNLDNPNNVTYVSNISGNSFDQEYLLRSEGYNSKASFNLAAQYDERLSFGLNLNSHFADYNQSTLLVESNDNEESLITNVRFENNLRTLSNGFSFQLGTIAKINQNVRVGLTYDSPTWYTISEEASQIISTSGSDAEGEFDVLVNPRVINIFQDYELKVPGKYSGSFAYLFGKQGLISFDYSYSDFSNLTFRPTNDPFFQRQNQAIANTLKGVSTFKVGGEYRIKEWSLRAGYRFQESPYQDGQTLGDLTGYSIGAGYNWGNVKFDFAVDRSEQDRNQSLFNTGLTSQASIARNNTAIVGTLTFSL
ncbi:OmpP1/FadL family transporter [Dokdonia ponticola]|uniref:OmpP1/FadL family transporter n=1 Tax=Dokdonia ponticola TaxID=2041041 RepID=A0ABV9HVY4_9FLAO